MKLVVAVVHDEDSLELIDSLNEKDYRVTKLASTGGFLKSGNTTLIVGVSKEKTEDVINIIENICKKRTEIIQAQAPIGDIQDMGIQYPMEVKVGGATIFVLDVDQFIKI